MAQGAALLAVLALGGVLVWRELDERADERRGNAAAGGQLTGAPVSGQPYVPGVLPGMGNLLPVGTTAPRPSAPATVADLAALQRAEAERAAALQRQNQIDTLRRDLARVWNDIDVQVVQANAVKNRVVDAGFRSAVITDVWQTCEARHTFFPTTQCKREGTEQKAEAAVASRWAERIALELQPIQAQLSRLNAEQLALINNLRALGYQVPQVDIKKASV